jgi:hypothetical protein
MNKTIKILSGAAILFCVGFTLLFFASKFIAMFLKPPSAEANNPGATTARGRDYIYIDSIDIPTLKTALLANLDSEPAPKGFLQLLIPLDIDSVAVSSAVFHGCDCSAQNMEIIRYQFRKGGKWEIILDTIIPMDGFAELAKMAY